MIARHWGRKAKTPTLYSGFPWLQFEQVNLFQSYSPCRSNPAHGNLRWTIYFKHKLVLRKFSLEVFHYHACWVIVAYNITFSNCTATLWLQDIEVGKQKHLQMYIYIYQADQLNFRQVVVLGVWNLHQNDCHCFKIRCSNLRFLWLLYCF
jgi:hypothetical protein